MTTVLPTIIVIPEPLTTDKENTTYYFSVKHFIHLFCNVGLWRVS